MTAPNNLIAILTADWHFMHNAWRHRPEICYDAEVSLSQVILLSHQTGLPIIAAGDLFDTSRLTSSLVQKFNEIIGVQADMSLNYFICGNHDKTDPPWMQVLYKANDRVRDVTGWQYLSEMKNPSPLNHRKTYNAEKSDRTWTCESRATQKDSKFGWIVYGLDYTETREKLQEKLDQLSVYSPVDSRLDRPFDRFLLVLHQGIDGLVPHMAAELSDGMLPDSVDLVLCGHTHISGVSTLKTKSGKEIPIVSPGSLHLCSINEQPKKKIYCLAADGSIWSTPLVTRRVIAADFCTGTESEIREASMSVVASLQKRIKPEIAKLRERISVPIVRVVYDSSTAPKAKSIFETALKEANAEAHIFYTNKAEKVSNDLDAVIDDGIDAAFVNSGFDYAKAAFQNLEKDKTVRKIVETMLETQPSQESYTQIKDKFLQHNTPCQKKRNTQ